jgi:hypothetical protein
MPSTTLAVLLARCSVYFWPSTRLDRKNTILLGCVVAGIGVILQGTAKVVAHLIVGREFSVPLPPAQRLMRSRRCRWGYPSRSAHRDDFSTRRKHRKVWLAMSICSSSLSNAPEAHRRGMLISVELTLCALGLSLSQWINYGFGSNDTAAAFQFPIFC